MKFVRNKLWSAKAEDAELLDEYRRAGDPEVLGRLYQRYMPLVYGLCLKYLKDEDKSKDAVMQIFEELVHKLRKHEVNNFKSWLYTLSRNYCLMWLRRANKRSNRVQEEDFEEMEMAAPEPDYSAANRLTVMEKCMEKLPEEQKVSLDLFYLQEKCYKEVAEITGYDINKVKSYIQNGKRNLKICIEKNGGNERRNN